MRRDARSPRLLAVIVFTLISRPRLPAGDHRHLPGRLPRQGGRLEGDGRRQGRRLEPDRPVVLAAGDRQERQAGARRRRRRSAGARQALLPAASLGRPATRPTSPTSATPAPTASKSAKRCAKTLAAYLKLEKPYDKSLTSEDVPVDAVTHVGLRRRPPHLRSQRADPGAPDRRRSPAAARPRSKT